MDSAKVVCQPELSVAVGAGNERAVDGRLLAVDVEELRGGLEVGAGETGVGVRAVLLGRPPALAVGQAVSHSREVVFGPLGIRGDGVGVTGNGAPSGVDPLGAVALERVAHGVVVDLGVAGCHARAGVTEEALDDVLGHAGVNPGCRQCDGTGGRGPALADRLRRAHR